MRKLIWIGMAVIGLASASCGQSNNLYPVSGSVIYKGNPAAGATVFLRHKGGNAMNDHTIMGIVQEDGSFALVCGPLGEGAPPGEYDVLIEWKHDLKQPKGLNRKGHDRLKGRYADPAHPRLQAVVKAETNHLAPLEITD